MNIFLIFEIWELDIVVYSRDWIFPALIIQRQENGNNAEDIKNN
jgi:hypothetical protein